MSVSAPTQELVERWASHQLRRRSGSSDGRKVRKALGLRARPTWASTTTTLDDVAVDLRVCSSPIGVRQALADHDPRDLSRQLVVITDFDQHDLGSDVLARLADGRLRTIEEREIVSAMFQVQSIEPRLRRDSTLIKALISHEPTAGWGVEPSGLLSYDRAAELLLNELFELEESGSGLNPLMTWALGVDASPLQEVDVALRNRLVEWLESRLGVPARLTMNLTIAGRGSHIVAFALASRLIASGAGDITNLERARVRLEHELGGARLSDGVLAQWATAAERYARKRLADGVQPAALVPGSSEVLDELGLVEAAGASEVLPEGYAARCYALAGTLNSFLTGPSKQGLQLVAAAEKSLRDHAIAATAHYAQRTKLCGIAIQLCAWMIDAPARTEFGTSDIAATWYMDEGAWVDSLRDQLAASSFGVAELDDSIEELLREAATRRHELNRVFADAIMPVVSNSTMVDDGVFVGVEHIAGRTVSAVAEHMPVLFLVVDGLSIAAWIQLQDSFVARGWDAVNRSQGPLPRAAYSTVPSVTRVARTSLFCGTIREGGEREEKAGLAAIGSIQAAISASGVRGEVSVLHKKELRGDGARPLASAARATILNPEMRVVGVVVNAIDDLLAKADQAHVSYSAELMPVLDAVLDAAAEGGRAIIVTSDHGHLLDRGTRFLNTSGAAEARTRARGEELADGELEVSGTRVIAAGGSLVAAWSESIRYTKGRSRGYHGGVSPQELIVPISVMLLNGVQHPAFQRMRATTPAWWTVNSNEDVVSITSEPVAIRPPKRVVSSQAQPTLFDPVQQESGRPLDKQSTAAASWVTQLVQTPRLQSQLLSARRFGITEEQVVQALTVLDARGGTAPTGLLAQAVGMPQLRVSGFLSALRRVLTWDGVDVLEIDHAAGIVTLSTQRLKLQFGVDEKQ